MSKTHILILAILITSGKAVYFYTTKDNHRDL